MNNNGCCVVVADILKGTTISTRTFAGVIKERIDAIVHKTRVVNIDLRDIAHVSRSFAHELILLRNEYQKKDIQVEFSNLSQFVKKMVGIVEKGNKNKIQLSTPQKALNLQEL